MRRASEGRGSSLTLGKERMNMLTMLLGRILAGERYQHASEEDTRIWVSLLAAFPLPVVAGARIFSRLDDPSLAIIWLAVVFTCVAFLGLWLVLFRTLRLRALSVTAIVGWLLAFLVAFYRL